jgi:anaerobic magnesium-protoporphyrin IX monomethyl ester cyclase
MLDVLLLEPPSNMQKIQKLRSRTPRYSASLPFVYMAPYLMKKKFNIEFLDMRLSAMLELKEILVREKPVVAGITIMPGSLLPLAIKLNKIIKKYSPETKIIWGGSFPSLHYEFCLGIPNVDIVVCGEGEFTLTELVSFYKYKTSDKLKEIRGIAFNDGKKVITTQKRELVNLDDHPIGAWDILDKYIDNYLGDGKFLTISTARGCPFKCSFCYNNLLYKGFKSYRCKSVKSVLEEIDYLMNRYGLKKLEFLDDDFLGNKKRGIEILSIAHKKYPDLKFHIKARISDIKDEDTVKIFAETGCETMFVGAESGSAEQLKSIKKGCSTVEMLEAAKLCKKYNIAVVYSFTCGYPKEKVSDLSSTVTMAENIKSISNKNKCIMEIISPIKGTPIYDNLYEKNLIPNQDIKKWCYMTDWKSAKSKPWITMSSGFYETFQLMFFFAFGSTDFYGNENIRGITRLLSRWALIRLTRMKKNSIYPEFRIANMLLKVVLWKI